MYFKQFQVVAKYFKGKKTFADFFFVEIKISK